MICIPSRQLGLIQNKLCGQKQFERAAKGKVAYASDTGEKYRAGGRKAARKDSLP